MNDEEETNRWKIARALSSGEDSRVALALLPVLSHVLGRELCTRRRGTVKRKREKPRKKERSKCVCLLIAAAAVEEL